MIDDVLHLADLQLTSRVLLGSASYPNPQLMLEAIEASGTQMVTVSMRRIPANQQGSENLYTLLKERGIHILPNTSSCFTAKEAILTAELAREALQTNWIKLEVIADENERARRWILSQPRQHPPGEVFEPHVVRVGDGRGVRKPLELLP